MFSKNTHWLDSSPSGSMCKKQQLGNTVNNQQLVKLKKLYPKLPLTNCLLIDINYLLPEVFSDLDVIDWKNGTVYQSLI